MADNVQNNPKLATTIKVADQEYDIHAVQANKVKERLIINKSGLSEETSETIEFNGETEQELSVVPTEGGTFTGPIQVNKAEGNYTDNLVINYHDIHDVLLKELLNNSILYEWKWNGNTGTLTVGGSGSEVEGFSDAAVVGNNDTVNVKSICIIKGSRDHVDEFAKINMACKKFSAFIYVAAEPGIVPSTDPNSKYSGYIYFGTSESNTPVVVQVSASHALSADTAGQLDKNTILKVNLESSNSQVFNGSTDVELGVTGVLNEINGGTGQNSLRNVTVGNAAQLETARKITVNLASTSGAYFDGTAAIRPGVTGTLPVANGGTGQTNLANVSVGKATNATNAENATNIHTHAMISTTSLPSKRTNSSKIVISTIDPEKLKSPAATKFEDYDIWIKYTTN